MKPGHTNNPNGRPKGVPNKTTAELRAAIQKFLDDTHDQFLEDWKALDPRDRVSFREKLLKYVLPTLQATSLAVDFESLTDEQLTLIISDLKKQLQ